jgi:GTP-binding protein EngB required for normal cell division
LEGRQVFAPGPIGSDLEALRRELIVCGSELRTTAPLRGVSFIDDTLNLLVRLTCRIAIVGQVKAGKSSFVNALVRKRDLLPTDVNPWTTAVTHLHFGRVDAPANVTAEFTFFDSNEWEHLAKGGGYIRELTQRLVPGFEAELLEKHLHAMRRQSEVRLGATLDRLLGRKHSFSTVSKEILERYVCSGVVGALSEDTDQKGLYSDVVKWADLYFDSSDFSFPTTIIDTPGTNDPFLVRDEITRRALQTADIYVVMLTARQALSSADVALLRILRGLNKERIAVFINRIDELADLAGDTHAVVQHVRTGLQREFPASEIPIVAGSAFWATTAIFASSAELEHVLSDKVRAYAAQLRQKVGLPSPVNDSDDERARTLLLCSGLPAISHVLADLTLKSHTGLVLKQVSRSFVELVEVAQNAVRHEVQLLEREQQSSTGQHQVQEGELDTVEAEAKENERLAVALQHLLLDLQHRTDEVIDKRCKGLAADLRDAVLDFCHRECENLRRAIAEGQRGGVWTCQTTELRQIIEERFISSYDEARQEIGKLEAHVFPKLKQLLSRHYAQWREPQEHGRAESAEPPSLGALSQVVALDLEEPWWKRWWSGSRGMEERAAEIDHLIKQEFYPILEALGLNMRNQLKAQQSSTLQRATLIYMGLVEVLQEQTRARRARTRVLMKAGDARRKTELRRDSKAHAEELKKQLSRMDLAVRRLENIDRRWGVRIS